MILIPVKGFETAKQRLAPVLSLEERAILARTMLEDVLRALAASNGTAISLITSDESARQVALRFGCATIDDRKASSETEAVAMATRSCVERGVTSILVIPGDVPLIEAHEIHAVLDALPGPLSATPGIVLVPAHDGRGTNAALLCPPGILELRFGNDSFELHLRAAREATRHCRVLRLPGIGLDIDSPGDIAQLLRVETRTESQRLLHSWNVADRFEAHATSNRQAWRITT